MSRQGLSLYSSAYMYMYKSCSYVNIVSIQRFSVIDDSIYIYYTILNQINSEGSNPPMLIYPPPNAHELILIKA